MTPEPRQISRTYGFIRGRQLDGTFPGEPATGVWGITSQRVACGWGAVWEEDWPYPDDASKWPPLEPPGLDTKAKQNRIFCYQRIRNSLDCKLALARCGPVRAAVEITDQWYDAEKGVIQMPPDDEPIEGSHGVLLTGYSDADQMFQFINSWGPDWGDGGMGKLPYRFFDRWMIEAYTVAGPGVKGPEVTFSGVGPNKWHLLDFQGRLFHVRELYDKDADERIGWVFAVEQFDFLDVEELYVRPQFRRRGYGRRLMELLHELASNAKRRLRFLIPFADCRPDNLPIAEEFLAKWGYSLGPINVRWAAYAAVQAAVKKPESVYIPQPPALCRPKSTRLNEGLPIPPIPLSPAAGAGETDPPSPKREVEPHDPLAQELSTYRRELPRMLATHPGEYALVHGQEVVNFYPTHTAAYMAGCERFGLDPFLIKKVAPVDPVYDLYIGMDLPCQQSTGR